MTDQHPITPPPELLQQWAVDYWGNPSELIGNSEKYIAIEAARWGADQELEACCEWLHWQNLATHTELIPSLRATRRPKSPSLKEQALEALRIIPINPENGIGPSGLDIIRRALEALPND